eukprot:GHVP01063153.1.p1 GENE.GHVP01063153.1~~GHVP01063153.1.p1  ORF type:complete len:184 (+),score=29.44 GHVP01063153.1:193-744(+)
MYILYTSNILYILAIRITYICRLFIPYSYEGPSRNSKSQGTIDLGKIKEIKLWGSAMKVLDLLKLPQDNVLYHLQICCWKESEIVKTREDKIYLGQIKSIELKQYAVNLLSFIEVPKDNKLRKLSIFCDETHLGPLREKSKNINIGNLEETHLEGYAVNFFGLKARNNRLEKEESDFGLSLLF